MSRYLLSSHQLAHLAVMVGSMLGTSLAGVLSAFLVMPLLRMSPHLVEIGKGRILWAWPGRRVTVVWRVWPPHVATFGVWRDVRSLAIRAWMFVVFQLVAVLGWGRVVSLPLTPGLRQDVWFGTLAAAFLLLLSRTTTKRPWIATVLNPLPKTDRRVLARTVPLAYAELRFARGDDKPMRALAAAGNPDSQPWEIAYIEGRFADALETVDRRLSLLAARNPAAAEKSRTLQAVRIAELALYAAEARQIPVAEGVARAGAAMAGQPLPLPFQALISVLSGDPEAALRPARRARRQPDSRLDLADRLCTLAHVQGVLGDRATAHELLGRARALVPQYGRPDHVARRLEGADPEVVAVG